MTTHSNRMLMLLVDDDDDVRKALTRAFGRDEFNILEAPNAMMAERLLRGMKPDVVISDFNMPGMDGIEFLYRVKLSHPDAVRILLTGTTDIRVAARAINEGVAHRFLVKPWQKMDIVGIVRLAAHAGRPSGKYPAVAVS